MGMKTTPPTAVCGQEGSARPPPLAPGRVHCCRRRPKSAPREFKIVLCCSCAYEYVFDT